MKRYIKSNTDNELTNQSIVELLRSRGIDTTKAKYELKAQRYERYEEGATYTKRFMCPGDYFAYFSMHVHEQPSASNLDYWTNEFEEMLDECPTVDDMREYATCYWWGDGDDFIIYLKNLSTGEYLYGPEYIEEEYDEEDWED